MLNERHAGDNSSGGVIAAEALEGAQRQKVLYEWNATSVAFPQKCAHRLFEEQAARSPDAIAVVFGQHRLSYRELNERSNRLAHHLRRQGVGPEVLAGVCLARSPELVVALLALWKAGGAYVPLDPAYPPERLSFMAQDSGASLVISDRSLQHLFPSVAPRLLCIDAQARDIERENPANPQGEARLSELAYVMYTSGSTGRPKGAMILHRGLTNYLWWAIGAYALKPGASVPVHTSISFDLTVTSLYPALLCGAQVELLPEDIGAQNLLDALRRARRGLVKITPAHLELLNAQLGSEEIAGMTDAFVIGGENLPAESLRSWRSRSPGTRLINEYGPTETVVGCCVHEVSGEDPANGPVPIGRPIANTRLYVLDAALQPVRPGVPGELFIGGVGVARGYLNRPDLTREKFVPDTFSGEPEARLYRTGDLARYRADGVLEYIGRVDDQVKVRGYRIELGEIEQTLAAHPDVQSCVVLAREDTPGSRQLVGYAIPRAATALTVQALQEYLRARLPEYMTPAKFVLLEAFPLTHNGKVDRKALPPPAAHVENPANCAAATLSSTQNRLCAIWRELLEAEHVDIRQDVFDLGAHSLMAVKAVSRIRDAFKVDLQLRNLFESPSVAAQAEVIERLLWAAGGGHAEEGQREEIWL